VDYKLNAMAGAFAAGLLLVATPAWAYGRLDIDANAAHARIWVDGSPAGSLPTAIDLAAGAHRVKVTAPGRLPREFGVRVRDGQATQAYIALATGAGRKNRHRLDHQAQANFVHAHSQRRDAKSKPAHVPGEMRQLTAVGAPQGHVTKGRASASAHALTARANETVMPRLLPAPAWVVTSADGRQAPTAPDPSRLAPPPLAGLNVPAPIVAEPNARATAPPVTLLGFDSRAWGDFGLVALLGALVAGLAGMLAKGWRRQLEPQVWTARRPARGKRAPDSTERLVAPAWDAIERGDWELATRLLWGTLAARGGSAWLYYHLGLGYQALGREMEAEAAYRSAIQVDAAHVNAAYNLGVMLDGQGHSAQAAIAYRKHLEAHPDDADALFNLGHLYRELDMPRQAEVHWRAARQIAPKDRDLRRDLGSLRRALRSRQKRQPA
jgi:Tfp pilus assembly protein PilF